MITITEVPPDQYETVIPLLNEAEEWEPALRWGLEHLSDAVYRLDEDGALAGAVSVQWRADPAEIEELAIDPARRGRGLGRQLVAWVLQEARRRNKRAVIVGTANSSILNLKFYQLCGFRLDHVRKDYFRYYPEPRFEDGLQIRDLIMFRIELE